MVLKRGSTDFRALKLRKFGLWAWFQFEKLFSFSFFGLCSSMLYLCLWSFFHIYPQTRRTRESLLRCCYSSSSVVCAFICFYLLLSKMLPLKRLDRTEVALKIAGNYSPFYLGGVNAVRYPLTCRIKLEKLSSCVKISAMLMNDEFSFPPENV